jgi:NADPH:quinone reductase-like Zn-dependent oxidoreductase
MGAEVTGVCSTRNVEMVRSLGADRVTDYTQEDFIRTAGRHHLMLDIGGTRSWRECKHVLEENGILVVVGGPKTNRLVGPLGKRVGQRLLSVIGSRKVALFMASPDKADLEVLRDLLASGEVKPVVERTYELDETADAFRYLGTGHAKAKLVVAV